MRDYHVAIVGATGMVGIEVLHECINHRQIQNIVSVGRHTTGIKNHKLKEVEHYDFLDYSSLEPCSTSEPLGQNMGLN